jgi:cathepsin B
VGLPRSFDAREAFPECAHLIGSVRDQGKCGSCWAVAAVEVMNDRLCVATKGRESRELSAEYPLACYAEAGKGCDGGDVALAMNEMVTRGVPYGGMLPGSEHSCLPYEFEPCDHPCQVPGTAAAACPATCADGSAMTLVKPESGAYTCPAGDWACIANEIMAYGSVAVTFGTVHEDFYAYDGEGVYRVARKDRDEPGLGQHATKLIGWGFARDREPYWIMMNSWRNWGKDGAGFVGVGEMSMESGIAAMKMK